MKDTSRQKKLASRLNPWTVASQRVHSLSISNSDKDIIIQLFKKAYTTNSIELLHIGTRKRKFVETQAIIIAVIYEYFKITLKQLGYIIEKHHATSLHYINLYEDVLCSKDKNRELYEMLADYINKELYGNGGNESYNVFSKDNKELKILCKKLILENKTLHANMQSIKAIVNV